MPIAVRIVLTANGREVACATSDIGTGTYTIMTQVAAGCSGCRSITCDQARRFNAAAISGRRRIMDRRVGVKHIATTAGRCVTNCCSLQRMPASPLAEAQRLTIALVDGKLMSRGDASRAVSITDAMRHGGVDRIEQEKTTTFANDGSHAHNTHSAIFAEVKVDEQLGVIRVTRVVNAVAAGRILNTKTASSQIIGGVVWGIGMALHEETLIDHTFGRIMNANIADTMSR